MRILELRFKNLNSLYGEWVIDFTAPEYDYDGIFAITGPTGAGKSTILDAVCLALYGRTPRLKSIAQSSNEIMSRQTGECFAQVSFETRKGAFQCNWSQQKAWKKADGKLGSSKHEISDVKTGKVLESKKREVALTIERETGMDFDRFTRSMLLAQGGFAAFLTAAPDLRSPILEQITGTRIYSEISKGVHERWRSEEATLERLRAETAGIGILSDDAQADFIAELGSRQALEKELNKKNDELGKLILWLKGMDALKAELSDIHEESLVLSNDLKAFEPDREKLQHALKAAEIEGEYAGLISRREQLKIDLKTLAVSKEKLPEQEKIFNGKEKDFEKAEEAVAKTKEDLRKESITLKTVRALDFHVLQKRSALKVAGSDCQKIEVQVSKIKEKQKQAKSSHRAAANEISKVEGYLSSNARDGRLVTELTGINEQIKNLQGLMAANQVINSQISGFKKQYAKETARYKKQKALCRRLGEKHTLAQKRVQETGKIIETLLGDRLLREYRSEHESLLREMVYLREIASLEDKRKKLEDGTACPLCGSLHHPFAQGNVPLMDETEEKIKNLSSLIRKVDRLENEMKKDGAYEKAAGSERVEAEKQLMEALHKRDDSKAGLLRCEKDLEAAVTKIIGFEKSLISTLEPFGMGRITGADLDSVSESLGIRQKNFQDHQLNKTEIEKNMGELAGMIKSCNAILKSLNDSMKEKQTILEALQTDFGQLTVERKTLYGEKNPDKEEARLEGRIVAAEKAQKKARDRRDAAGRQLDALKTRISALKENTVVRKPELDILEATFKDALQKAGFEDEPTFIEFRLPLDKRKRLNQRAKALDEKSAQAATRKKDREAKLVQETQKKLTPLSLDDLQKEMALTQESLKRLGEEVGAIKQKLSDNLKAKARLQQKIKLIDAQKTEVERWDALHLLIGSADGKKYRNFAQGLTFEVMVSHANQQLVKMSDRYLLVRDEKHPLELNIVDNYQAGEIRSTKNLSGGESFIVSLSLALGLSNMASRNIRVDSLFLDEGFGTLDEDALETALDALSGLHQKGKLIGIISHVSALKERIGTQINILPVSGGKSRITGPGIKGVHP